MRGPPAISSTRDVATPSRDLENGWRLCAQSQRLRSAKVAENEFETLRYAFHVLTPLLGRVTGRIVQAIRSLHVLALD
jgi:hypothetical protein